ncbi:MAG: preprotein translocase subunit SecG [Bacteroidetes bacterium]|nr:MAG: preprotein translocase subunit SecG [Bacteroidota bacterium]MBL1145720.1 preprotein translocase subunit SecG [Bacteroidota bacterium]MCB0803214.1 preprotein translocase subunit SecG [Flavobacteriales bacterium]NOG58514.1 preprotein translocase subunit SecG [Bacteroidota bacterium]
MFIFVSVLIFLVAILLILVILVQNPKGGLASNFSSSNQVMGVRKTTDFLEKATWSLGIALIILSVISSSLIGGTSAVVTTESELTEQANQVIIPQNQAPQLQEGVPAGQSSDGALPVGDGEDEE